MTNHPSTPETASDGERGTGWQPVPPGERPAYLVAARHKATSELYVLMDVRSEVRNAIGPFTMDQINSGTWKTTSLISKGIEWARDQEWEYIEELESLFPSLMDEGRRIGSEIVDSLGYNILRRQWELGWSYQVFYGNAQELIHFLDALSAHRFPEHWISEDNQGIVFGYVVRMLHNFVASAMALKDHCVNVYMPRHYPDKGHSFYTRYSEEIKARFQDNTLWKFMQDLRNYTMHWGLPSVSLRIAAASPQDRLELTIRLDVDKLKEWDGWTSQSQQHIDKLPDRVSLQEIVEEYKRLVTDFYDWLIREEREQHGDDISAFEEQRQQLCNIFDLGSLSVNQLAHLFGFWAAPATWLPEIEKEKQRAARYQSDLYPGLVKALHALIEGTTSTTLPPSEFVAAMNITAMAWAPGKTNFRLALDQTYIDGIRVAQADLEEALQKNRLTPG